MFVILGFAEDIWADDVGICLAVTLLDAVQKVGLAYFGIIVDDADIVWMEVVESIPIGQIIRFAEAEVLGVVEKKYGIMTLRARIVIFFVKLLEGTVSRAVINNNDIDLLILSGAEVIE